MRRLIHLTKRITKALLPEILLNSIIKAYATHHLTNAKQAVNAIGKIDSEWRTRIDDVISSPDNNHIKRVPNAGTISNYHITMHNGVKVCANGYYGNGILNMLIENKGVHEPQEEKAFEEIIQLVPENCTMLELGAYWGFYSLSLLQARPNAECHLVEPEIFNITSGKINFSLNNRIGHFHKSLVGELPKTKPATISVDSYCQTNSINHLNILHSDIQGFELSMLKGSIKMLSEKRIDYIFVSTHSNELHNACIEEIANHGYEIIASANKDETFSYDGLIIAKNAILEEPIRLEISKKTIKSQHT